jgi:soluble lytic murein transglycosylase
MRRNGLLLTLAVLVVAVVVILLAVKRESVARPEHVAAEAGSGPGAVPGGDTILLPGVPEAVTSFMRDGRSWRAARAMRAYLERSGDTRPDALLLAARAEAGWGGWERVSALLEGKEWLGRERGGEGWYWLARAREEDGQLEPAMKAYDGFLSASRDAAGRERRMVAQLRQGLILLRMGKQKEGAERLVAVRAHAPEIGSRLDVLAAEALATSGDTAGVRKLTADGLEGSLVRRGRVALVTAYDSAGDAAGARAEARAAGLLLDAARLSLELGDTAAARADLRAVLRNPASAGVAGRAAAELDGLGALEAGERLRVARALAASGRGERAAALYRDWLRGGGGSEGERSEVRLALGRALYGAGESTAAVEALKPIAGAGGRIGADALLLMGRARQRLGNRASARATFLQLADRHPGSVQGSEGLFLVADLSHDDRKMADAKQLYRRVASGFRGTDRAGLSLMRLAGIAFEERKYADAAKLWEEYRTSYPKGERWLQSTYWEGRAEQAVGDTAGARALYRATLDREPLSYYSLVASRRLDRPYWPIPMDSAPPADRDAAKKVAGWVHGVELLEEAGLHSEANAEADLLVARADTSSALLYPLGEALSGLGFTVQGIRIGYRLLNAAPRPNPRILRLIYPFPYRPMLVAESRERSLDPFLVAALIRQESSFQAHAASGPGARGLMQIMPATGRTLARAAGIDSWNTGLLFQPEINAHLGTRFLADQMKRYDESLPSVFAAYNAGPGRVERWSDFPEMRDPELFTERIPYRETRDYVKILTRNAALYRGLYGP